MRHTHESVRRISVYGPPVPKMSLRIQDPREAAGMDPEHSLRAAAGIHFRLAQKVPGIYKVHGIDFTGSLRAVIRNQARGTAGPHARVPRSDSVTNRRIPVSASADAFPRPRPVQRQDIQVPIQHKR